MLHKPKLPRTKLTFKDRIEAICDPRFWIRNYTVDLEWDYTLNQAIKNYGITGISFSVASIGPLEIWIGNYPYAFGTLDGYPECMTNVPKRSTAIRLKKMVDEYRDSANRKALYNAIHAWQDTVEPAPKMKEYEI